LGMRSLVKIRSGAALVGKQLLQLTAQSLGLPQDSFSQHYSEKRSPVLRWNFYPACPQPADSLGILSQTDLNLMTLLLQDMVGGLQVEKDGQWIGIKPIDGAFIVNIGDTLHVSSLSLNPPAVLPFPVSA
jgi:isopenicillin N synthase-like dioxygenase